MTKQKAKFYNGESKNRNSVRRTVAAVGRWSLVVDLVAGAGLVVVGLMVTGAGLVAAVVGLVAAIAGRWSLVQDWQLLVQVW